MVVDMKHVQPHCLEQGCEASTNAAIATSTRVNICIAVLSGVSRSLYKQQIPDGF